MKNYSIIKNEKFGFMEVEPKPSPSELENYYKEKYYQQNKATYLKEYPDNEIKYIFNKISQKEQGIKKINLKSQSIIDIGCGEGFSLEYFSKKGWKVKGLDYSSFGIQQHHPHLNTCIETGNLLDLISNEIERKNVYDVILLDNVLEHSVSPERLLQSLVHLSHKETVLVIEVPNDYSILQEYLTQELNLPNYWEAFPDHLIYFSKKSLCKLMEETGWNTRFVLADFPIEWYLVNENSNYILEKSKGKAAHRARVEIENLLHNTTSFDSLFSYYSVLADIGQGRQIIGYFTPA